MNDKRRKFQVFPTPHPKQTTIDTAILRQFIRFNIPPIPRDVVTRESQYIRQLGALTKRKQLPLGAKGALTERDFRAKSKRLKAEADSDIERLLADPHSYRYWRPTGNDWRSLAILQMMWAHGGKNSEPDLLVPLPKHGRGRPQTGKSWYYAHFIKCARRKLVMETETPAENIARIAVAEEAVNLMKAAVKAGDWDGEIPKPTTLEVEWNNLNIDDLEKSPAFPPNMQLVQRASIHYQEIENAANSLGRCRELFIPFGEFADWAFAQISADYPVPDRIETWRHAEWLNWLAELAGCDDDNHMPTQVKTWAEHYAWINWLKTRADRDAQKKGKKPRHRLIMRKLGELIDRFDRLPS